MVLSHNDEPMLVGNFLGDFLRNKAIAKLPADVQSGVELHRFIDTYTDIHPQVRKCTKLLRKSQGKYAPVVTDVLFDYILVQNWETYMDVSFEEFTAGVYDTLGRYRYIMPDVDSARTQRMIDGRFLSAYISKLGISNTFIRIAKRTSFDNNLDHATDDLILHYDKLEENFNIFFPDIMKKSKTFIENISDI